MRDLHSNILAVSAIGAAALDADNTPAAIDLQGYDSAEILLAIGVGGISFSGSNKIEFKLTHSDDNVTYDPVGDSDVLGLAGAVGAGGIIKALTAAHAAAAAYRVGYKGNRRYLKLLADFSGTHGTATPIAAIVLKGNGSNRPEVNQA